MLIKRTWTKKVYGIPIKQYIGYFLFGFIPLYVEIIPLR